MSDVVSHREFVERLTELGQNECECGSTTFTTYSVGGEMSALYLMHKNQTEAAFRGMVEGTGATITGQTVYGITCDDCGLVRLYDPKALGLT